MNNSLINPSSLIQLGIFICLLIGNPINNHAQCGFQPITLFINGIEQEVAASYELKGPVEIILKLINESEIQNCAYKFGKIQITGNGGFSNYLSVIESKDFFSNKGAIAKIVISPRLYQELKNQKKIRRLHLTIFEVFQKDEEGNISVWKRWDDRNYQFTLN